jgi:hypothetical protein
MRVRRSSTRTAAAREATLAPAIKASSAKMAQPFRLRAKREFQVTPGVENKDSQGGIKFRMAAHTV